MLAARLHAPPATAARRSALLGHGAARVDALAILRPAEALAHAPVIAPLPDAASGAAALAVAAARMARARPWRVLHTRALRKAGVAIRDAVITAHLVELLAARARLGRRVALALRLAAGRKRAPIRRDRLRVLGDTPRAAALVARGAAVLRRRRRGAAAADDRKAQNGWLQLVRLALVAAAEGALRAAVVIRGGAHARRHIGDACMQQASSACCAHRPGTCWYLRVQMRSKHAATPCQQRAGMQVQGDTRWR